MVGAGSSMFVGYKDWKGLVLEMAKDLVPGLINHEGKCVKETGEEASPSEIANKVREALRKNGEEQAYYNFLQRECGTRKDDQPNCDEVHISLVQLGFRGITTTNYDLVLEYALTGANRSRSNFYPEPIDLCADNRYKVHGFLRGLNDEKEPNEVLHIHGLYSNPKNIILTDEDYQTRYVPQPKLDEYRNQTGEVQQSFHRDVLYGLGSYYPFFFVGFGFTDDYFVDVLSILQKDFQLGFDMVHFATTPFTEPSDLEKTQEKFKKMGVMPLFYYVPPKKENEPEDHSTLKSLISELKQAVKGDRKEPTFEDVSRDWRELSSGMMER